ncbi:Inosine/uridine-preferring nucleoside hydrolase domain-containing protein [Leucosporidium creatinivorum]|uniref:Inosine/uridine-preferring nucleoside hydrolase domain-containing protein n=1 Tax=Leucosporidium creatinivorum TaxID=106004 RepID=A0A1Y2DZU6_9BASI|nr:Inosine/uridine-preferring nucleoside hydrolase domain-containing protein [Leucosporidium creatinivorum]
MRSLSTPARTKVFLDCDPGRDDAVAILLALHLPEIDLVGISSVHGNSTIDAMTYNAVRLLVSYGSAEQATRIPVFKGSEFPLVAAPRTASTIHGADGLGGVEGLLDMSNERVAQQQSEALKSNAIIGMADACKALAPGEKLTLVGVGAFTNIALFISVFPDLLLEKVSQIVLMGGAEGRGNKSPVSESNVYCDPHAASIVFDCPIPVVICPLNLTHTAIFTDEIHSLLLQPNPTAPFSPEAPLPPAASDLRLSLSTNLTHFAAAYKRKYGFLGPPLHDPLTIAYIARPELFKGTRYRVDVELKGDHSVGATVVDLWEYKKEQVDQDPSNWGRKGKNVLILEEVDVPAFYKLFLEAVDAADKVCPIGAR